MAVISLGAVRVTSPGTPVQLIVNVSTSVLNLAGTLSCYTIVMQPLSSNVGKVYVGNSVLSKTTLAGVHMFVPIPTANSLPFDAFRNETAQAGLNAAEMYIDADNANDGVVGHIIR